MRGNKKQSITQSKKYIVIPKKQFEKFLKTQTNWSKETLDLRRNMRELIVEEVKEEIGDKIKMIDGALTQTILMLRVFQDKGLITKDEIEEKHKELKSKR